jgi:hypothetical protein
MAVPSGFWLARTFQACAKVFSTESSMVGDAASTPS